MRLVRLDVGLLAAIELLRFGTVSAHFHVAPSSAPILAAVYEQPAASFGTTLTDAPQIV
jgi:hypothetical protein